MLMVCTGEVCTSLSCPLIVSFVTCLLNRFLVDEIVLSDLCFGFLIMVSSSPHHRQNSWGTKSLTWGLLRRIMGGIGDWRKLCLNLGYTSGQITQSSFQVRYLEDDHQDWLTEVSLSSFDSIFEILCDVFQERTCSNNSHEHVTIVLWASLTDAHFLEVKAAHLFVSSF